MDKRSNLNLLKDRFISINGYRWILNHNMVTPVATWFLVADVIPLLDPPYPAVVSEPLGSLQTFLELDHDAKTSNILHILSQIFFRNISSDHLFANALNRLDPSCDKTQLENALLLDIAYESHIVWFLILQLLGYTDLRSFPNQFILPPCNLNHLYTISLHLLLYHESLLKKAKDYKVNHLESE